MKYLLKEIEKKSKKREKNQIQKSITRYCSNSNNKDSTMIYLQTGWRGPRKELVNLKIRTTETTPS